MRSISSGFFSSLLSTASESIELSLDAALRHTESKASDTLVEMEDLVALASWSIGSSDQYHRRRATYSAWYSLLWKLDEAGCSPDTANALRALVGDLPLYDPAVAFAEAMEGGDEIALFREMGGTAAWFDGEQCMASTALSLTILHKLLARKL